MKNRYQLHDRNYLLRIKSKTSRDPEKQCFDNCDPEPDNEFTDLKIIFSYREIGEKVMQQNYSI
jgi:hypothetical protein